MDNKQQARILALKRQTREATKGDCELSSAVESAIDWEATGDGLNDYARRMLRAEYGTTIARQAVKLVQGGDEEGGD